MKKNSIIVLFIFISNYVFQQKIIVGGEMPFVNAIKIENDVINIDTSYYNGNQFYITNLKKDPETNGPALFTDYFHKTGWVFGARVSYSQIQYKSYGNGSYASNPHIAHPYLLEQRFFSYRLYLGKEFLPTKLLHPYFLAGITRYNYFYHKFDDDAYSATSAYNFSNYEAWLKKAFSNINTISIGGGINFRYLGISFYYDRTIAAVNSLIHSYSNASYCSVKYNLFSYQASRRIPFVKSNIGTAVSERAYVPPTIVGVSFERPIDGGFEIAKDTVTGFDMSDVEFDVDNDATFEDGSFDFGFAIVEIRKKAKMTSLSPTLTVYHEKSIRNSLNWFTRNAVSYRFFHMKYVGAVRNYDHNKLFLSNDPNIVDLGENRLSLINEYSTLTQEHEIGYRFIRGNKPNYFAINAGIRINWRIRHWNSFTAKVRMITPTISGGITYKINRFSFGLIGEHSIISPDNNGYYRYFYGINGQLNYDIYRARQ